MAKTAPAAVTAEVGYRTWTCRLFKWQNRKIQRRSTPCNMWLVRTPKRQIGRNLLSASNQAVEEKREKRMVSTAMNEQKGWAGGGRGEQNKTPDPKCPEAGKDKTIPSHLARPLQFET